MSRARRLLTAVIDDSRAINKLLAARIHLSYLAFEEGEEKEALGLLKDFLNMLVKKLGRDRLVQAPARLFCNNMMWRYL